LEALTNPKEREQYHLDPPYKPAGPGEQSILDTYAALRELQLAGKIRKIGIAGYPLPFLLRLALLIKEQTGRPIDIVQSYAHQTLLNSTLSAGYIAAFERAGVKQVVNAAPLSMGILTTQGGPDWHPIREVKEGRYYQATRDAKTWRKCTVHRKATLGWHTIERIREKRNRKYESCSKRQEPPIGVGRTPVQEVLTTRQL
jgi:aryl-alcohol dehydrogenase-like predicted oxidoreductase